MAGITGFGGAFLRADDPESLYTWYETQFGLKLSGGCFQFEAQDQKAAIAVAFFPRASTYFPAAQPAMLNFQVDELDALLDRLAAAGAEVDPKRDSYEFGRFGWFKDPEGNRVELFQPSS